MLFKAQCLEGFHMSVRFKCLLGAEARDELALTYMMHMHMVIGMHSYVRYPMSHLPHNRGHVGVAQQ